jgi:hypothetical protein
MRMAFVTSSNIEDRREAWWDGDYAGGIRCGDAGADRTAAGLAAQLIK